MPRFMKHSSESLNSLISIFEKILDRFVLMNDKGSINKSTRIYGNWIAIETELQRREDQLINMKEGK